MPTALMPTPPQSSLLASFARCSLVVFLSLVFLGWTFVVIFRGTRGMSFYWETPGHAAKWAVNPDYPVPEDGYAAKLFNGWHSFYFFLTAMGTLVAAWATVAYVCLPQSYDVDHSEQNKRASPLRRFWVQVKRVFQQDLPPVRMWRWLCGEVTVFDASLYIVWLGINAGWTYETFVSMFDWVSASLAGGYFEDYWEGTVTQARVEGAALTFGWITVVQVLIMFYPVPRSSFLHWLFDTNMPHIIKYHRWMSHFVMWSLSLHGILYYALWIAQDKFAELTFEWKNDGHINNLAGSIAWVFGLAVWIASVKYIRRRWYQVFYIAHCFGVPLFLLFSLMHWAQFTHYVAAGFVVYMLDLVFRHTQRTWNRSTATVTVLKADTLVEIKLHYAPDTEVVPAQYVHLSFPTMGQTWYHRHQPFSVAYINRDHHSNSQTVTLYAKTAGDWTRKLVAAAGKAEGQSVQLPVVVDGPYGSVSRSWRDADVLVMFGGGIGVTPFLAILQDIIQARAEGRRAPTRVYFIFSARLSHELSLLDSTMREHYDWLEMTLHHTGAKEQDMACAVLTRCSSGYDPSVKLLRGYGHGYLFYCLAICVAFFGCFLGFLPGAYYNAVRSIQGGSWLAPYMWVTGIIYTFSVPLAISLPVLIMIGAALMYRRMRAPQHPPRPASPSGSLDIKAIDIGKAMHAMADLDIKQGRPDVKAVLADIGRRHSDLPEISVYASGPAELMRAVRDSAQDLSGLCTSGMPYLDVTLHAFSTV